MAPGDVVKLVSFCSERLPPWWTVSTPSNFKVRMRLPHAPCTLVMSVEPVTSTKSELIGGWKLLALAAEQNRGELTPNLDAPSAPSVWSPIDKVQLVAPKGTAN